MSLITALECLQNLVSGRELAVRLGICGLMCGLRSSFTAQMYKHLMVIHVSGKARAARAPEALAAIGKYIDSRVFAVACKILKWANVSGRKRAF